MRDAMKKYRILLVMEILIMLIMLPACFQKENLVYADTQITGGAELGIYTDQGDRFQVLPGVYQVRIQLEPVQDGYIYAKAACDQSSFRAMRCNGANIYPGQSSLSFEIYVLEKIDSAYVDISFGGEKAAVINSVEVYRVSYGARMVAFIFACFSLTLNALLGFREEVLSGRIKKEQQVVVWGLLFSVLLAYYPYMTDYFSGAADSGFHWLRVEGLKETLLQGNQFPVRVQSYWLYDHGYAVSSFYGDLFLLIPVLFRVIGFSLMSSYKMFVFVVMAATAVISYYSFKQCTKNTYAALFGSIIYVLAPYRIYNFYNRAAVGEYLAMVFLPLVICGMYGLYTEDVESENYSCAKIPLIIGLSCILQSHLLTCEMTVIFMLIVCIIFFRKSFRKRTFLQLLQAAVMCLLLNAWFWLPLLKMMGSDSYFLSDIISQDIQYQGTWFAEVFQLYPNQGARQTGMHMAEPFQMGIASLLMLVSMLIVLFRKLILRVDKKYDNPYDKNVLFWCCSILVTWFMSTRYFPWDMLSQIPGVQLFATAIQFPTRLFSPVSVLCAASASFFFLWFGWECKVRIIDEKVCENIKKGTLAALLILAVGSSVYHVNDLAYHDTPIWLYNAENGGTISVVNGEYMLEGTAIEEYHYHGPVAEEGLEWMDYEKQGTSIQIKVNNTDNQEAALELPLIGYKGYTVEGNSTSVERPYIAEERGNHGDLKVMIPGGYQGNLKICYNGFLSYRIAELISLLTIIFILVMWIYKRRMQWKSKIK